MNYHRNVCDLVSLKWITIALAVLFLSLSFEASEVRGQDINVSTRRIAPFVEGTEYTIDVHLRTTSSNVANKPSTDIVINSNYGTVIAPDAFCVFAGKPPGCIGENICDGFTINTPITFTPAMWSEERSGSVYIWTTSTIPITLECPASVAAPASFGLLENHYIFTLRHGRVAREIELFYEDNTKFDIETELSIVQIDEGASAELGVRLASDPHSEATVIITGSNNTDLDNPDGNTSPNPTSLTFDATNYSDYQYFELWAKIDPDPDSETIPLTLTPADPRGIGKTVEVTVDDLYVGNPIVSINEVKINKGGTETFFVQLSCVKKDNKKIKLFCDANSATPVTIKITGHSGKGLTLSREEIKFTAGNNWTSDEYVTITADPNIAHDEIPLTITAQSGTHGFSGSEIVTVKIDDVDPTPNVEIKDVPPQIGNTGPFTAQFEWNKNVSYFGTEDVTVDGGAKGSWTRISNDVYTLDVTPAGSQDVVVTVLANRAEDGTGRTGPLNDVFETAEWIKIEASPLTQEIKEGQTGTLDVRLSTAPTKTVTVTIVSDKSDLLINPSTLTFEPTDFGDQEVTLTAQSVSSDQKVTLTLTGNNVSDGSAEVTIKNEPQALSVSLGNYTFKLKPSGKASV